MESGISRGPCLLKDNPTELLTGSGRVFLGKTHEIRADPAKGDQALARYALSRSFGGKPFQPRPEK
jgi:hypothetical protein